MLTDATALLYVSQFVAVVGRRYQMHGSEE